MEKPQPDEAPPQSTPASDMAMRDSEGVEWLKGCLRCIFAVALGLGVEFALMALTEVVPTEWALTVRLLCVAVLVSMVFVVLARRINSPPENECQSEWIQDHLPATEKPQSHGRNADSQESPILVFLFAGTSVLFFALFWTFSW